MAIKMSQIVGGSTIKNNSDWTTGVKDYITVTGSGANKKLQFSLPVDSEAQEPSSNSDVATKYYVDQAIAGLVNSAPAALDTIKELSDALGGDANFATTMTNALSAKVAQADVSITNTLDSGVKVATVTIGTVSDDIYVNIVGAKGATVTSSSGVITVTVPQIVQDSLTSSTLTLSKKPTNTLVKLFVNELCYVENKHFTVNRTTKAITWTYASFSLDANDDILAEYWTVDD